MNFIVVGLLLVKIVFWIERFGDLDVFFLLASTWHAFESPYELNIYILLSNK